MHDHMVARSAILGVDAPHMRRGSFEHQPRRGAGHAQRRRRLLPHCAQKFIPAFFNVQAHLAPDWAGQKAKKWLAESLTITSETQAHRTYFRWPFATEIEKIRERGQR